MTDEAERIGVVGAGIMGGGIAQMFAEQGRTVLLGDADSDRLEAGLAGIISDTHTLISTLSGLTH